MRPYQQFFRNVMSAMLTLKCTVIITREVAQANFTNKEKQADSELAQIDANSLIETEELLIQQPMPIDGKGIIKMVYTKVRHFQFFIGKLKDTLAVQTRSFQ